MSNDPIGYAEDIVKIVDQKINELPEIFLMRKVLITIQILL